MDYKSFNLGIVTLFFKISPLHSSAMTSDEVQKQLSGAQPVAITCCKMVSMPPEIYEAFASSNK